MATELTSKTFDDAIKKNVSLIDFWAPWCMPCKMLSPTIDQISEEYKGKLFVGKVNVDENQELATKYDVMSIPNMIVFKDGKAVDSIVGAVPKAAIKAVLDKHIQ